MPWIPAGNPQILNKFWMCVQEFWTPIHVLKSERQDYSPIAQTQKWGLGWDVAKTTPQDQGLSHRMVETRRPNKNRGNIFGLKGRRVGENFDSPIAAMNKNGMTRLKTNTEGTAEISAPIFHASLSDLSRFQFLLERPINLTTWPGTKT